jgi:hypothetical protein
MTLVVAPQPFVAALVALRPELRRLDGLARLEPVLDVDHQTRIERILAREGLVAGQVEDDVAGPLLEPEVVGEAVVVVGHSDERAVDPNLGPLRADVQVERAEAVAFTRTDGGVGAAPVAAIPAQPQPGPQ